MYLQLRQIRALGSILPTFRLVEEDFTSWYIARKLRNKKYVCVNKYTPSITIELDPNFIVFYEEE